MFDETLDAVYPGATRIRLSEIQPQAKLGVAHASTLIANSTKTYELSQTGDYEKAGGR